MASQPIKIDRATKFRETLKKYEKVFTMFYDESQPDTNSILPAFDSLCKSNTIPSVAFVKVEHNELPGLAVEHDIPRELVVAVFVNQNKIDMVSSPNGDQLRYLVSQYVRCTTNKASTSKSSAAKHSSKSPESSSANSGCIPHEPNEISTSPELVSGTSRSSRSLFDSNSLTIRLRWPDIHYAKPWRYYPAQLTHVLRLGSLAIYQPAMFEYEGRDGLFREASVRLARSGSRTVLTYLDQSGPIALEREIGKWQATANTP